MNAAIAVMLGYQSAAREEALRYEDTLPAGALEAGPLLPEVDLEREYARLINRLYVDPPRDGYYSCAEQVGPLSDIEIEAVCAHEPDVLSEPGNTLADQCRAYLWVEVNAELLRDEEIVRASRFDAEEPTR